MNVFIWCCVGAVILSSISQILLKKAARQGYTSFWKEYLNPWVIGGYALMMVALLVNVFAMSKGVNLKMLPAIEALGYVFVPLLSLCVFREKMGMRKMMAILLIVAGVVVFFM